MHSSQVKFMPYVWTTLTALIALLLVLFLSACEPGQGFSGKTKSPKLFLTSVDRQYLEQAEKQIKERDYKAAAETLSPLVAAYPGDAELHTKFGDVLRLQGKLDEAIEQYDASLNVFPGNPDAMEGKGLALVQKTEFREAITQFSRVLEVDANRWRSYNGVGVAFAAKGHHKDALMYYAKALEIEPENPLVHNNIALSFAAEKKFKDAISSLKTAVYGLQDDKEKLAQAELNLSLVYGLADMFEPAEMLLRRHLPEDKVFYNLGIYAKLQRNYDLASTYLSKALTSSAGVYNEAWSELNEIKPFLSAE